jgi:hypothetical protein
VFWENAHKSTMTILSEKRDKQNRMQPAKGHQTENETAKIMKWCKFARGI